jgi:predicted RecA/RadA family phage recombinase
MKNFVQPDHAVTVTASTGGVTLGALIVAVTSPVLYPIGTAMKAAGISAATVRVRLDGVAVVAAGA